jgi:hypothetical protein
VANDVTPQASPEELNEKLTQYRQDFLDSETCSMEERREAAEAREYHDGIQWTEEEAKILKARGQPVIVDNKVKDKNEYMLGLERKSRTDPKAFPRNPKTDEAKAEAATEGLRYVCDDNLWPFVCSEFAEQMFIEGRGAIEIILDPRHRGPIPKILVRDIPMDRTYVDPRSRRRDYTDAGYKGIVAWMDEDQALAKWSQPWQQEAIAASFDQSLVHSDTYEDRPHFFAGKGTKRRIQVFEHCYLDGEAWGYCKFVAGGFLEVPRPSVYIDSDTGLPECPIEMQALYREGRTGDSYSMFRRNKDPQDEWNKRRSKALHLLNTLKIIIEKGAAGSDKQAINRLRKELNRPDGVLELIPGLKWEILNGLEMSEGHLKMMLLAGESLRTSGPNAALMGQTGDLSGRAKELDQQGGLVQIDFPFDAVRHMKLRVYRHMWSRIKQYWTDETWLRVRKEEHVKFVVLNHKRTRGEVEAEALKKDQEMGEVEKALRVAKIALDPRSRMPIVENDIAQIDVEITIDDAPDVVALQQEQFQHIVEMQKAGVLQLPPRAIIKASQLRNKREILDELAGADDPMQQKAAMLTMRKQELEVEELAMKVEKLRSETAKNAATADESNTDAAIKTAEFIRGDGQQVPAEKQVRVS